MKNWWFLLVLLSMFLTGKVFALIPQGWEKHGPDQDGRVLFINENELKAVSFINLKVDKDNDQFVFGDYLDYDKYLILSTWIEKLGFCTEKSSYDVELLMATCQGVAKDDNGDPMPVIIYIQMVQDHVKLIMGMYNATEDDITMLIHNYK
ncbi:MAG: hypothetical protein ACI4VX_01340 [Succinivibrionaceae bacterium]